jgi:HEAT repeat protein
MSGISPSALQMLTDEIAAQFESLFAAGKDEFFQDGMESEFSKNLLLLLDRYGEVGVEILTDLIMSENVNPAVASEALRWVGQIENPATHLGRRRLLEQALSAASAWVRDGAVLGLASMDDPAALDAVKLVLDREQVSELRYVMEQVWIQLQSTQMRSDK